MHSDELFLTATENLLLAASTVSAAACCAHNSSSGAAGHGESLAEASASRHTGDFSIAPRGSGHINSSSSSGGSGGSDSSGGSGSNNKGSSGTTHSPKISSRECSQPVSWCATGSGDKQSHCIPPNGSKVRDQEQQQEQQQQQQWQQQRQLCELAGVLRSKVEVLAPEQLSVVRLLGGGAFGEVYLARWAGTEVAVKCLSRLLLISRGSSGKTPALAMSELLQEASLLASLHHPNIVSCFGVVLPEADIRLSDTGSTAAASGAGGSRRSSSSVQWSEPQTEQTESAGVCGSLGPTGAACQGIFHEMSSSSSTTTRAGGRLDPAGSMYTCGEVLHPSAPAIVTEYMPAGSLRSAISKQADWLNSSMAKVKMLVDTARVSAVSCCDHYLVLHTAAASCTAVVLQGRQPLQGCFFL
jgi:hypothetical protein